MINYLKQIKKIEYRFFDRSFGIPRDDQILKQEKLDAVARNFEIEPKNLITLSQVHSANFVFVTSPFDGDIPQADALITQTPGLLLGVLTADCVPILLASTDAQVIAAIHAGWRGALGGVIENTIQAMLNLGVHDVVAALGPCIWQDSYEVSQEFYDQLAQDSVFFKRNSSSARWQFDLPAYVTAKLLKAGVRHVMPSLANTYSDNNFYSFRRTTHHPEQELKSNLSVIGIF